MYIDYIMIIYYVYDIYTNLFYNWMHLFVSKDVQVDPSCKTPPLRLKVHRWIATLGRVSVCFLFVLVA